MSDLQLAPNGHFLAPDGNLVIERNNPSTVRFHHWSPSRSNRFAFDFQVEPLLTRVSVFDLADDTGLLGIILVHGVFSRLLTIAPHAEWEGAITSIELV